ncbi:MAG: hypothetical protein HC779_02710 [Phyllobacteriaceae bacterium]|nr:hypothetical protein [Phyllobacteriaceae bacterium]
MPAALDSSDRVLVFCFEDTDVLPWRTRDRTGLNFTMMEAVSARTGLAFHYQGRPWRRCQDDLRAGRNFQIVELNGAASEATSIYDSRNSLFGAYRTLFHQWELVFAIGAAKVTEVDKSTGGIRFLPLSDDPRAVAAMPRSTSATVPSCGPATWASSTTTNCLAWRAMAAW